MSEEISINFSTCKKFMTIGGVRASKEAITVFQQKLNARCIELGKSLATMVEQAKRKTVLTEDVERVF